MAEHCASRSRTLCASTRCFQCKQHVEPALNPGDDPWNRGYPRPAPIQAISGPDVLISLQGLNYLIAWGTADMLFSPSHFRIHRQYAVTSEPQTRNIPDVQSFENRDTHFSITTLRGVVQPNYPKPVPKYPQNAPNGSSSASHDEIPPKLSLELQQSIRGVKARIPFALKILV
ncbi:hypothetical protein BDZ91DRAFT_764362 [Kalaharituber pfeilii]|nr:hypothetical protein BDZ91DRAFT_764362 [Kalaharituber pfeilii]